MAFLLNNTSIASHFKTSSQKTDGAFTQSHRGFHVELGPREKGLLADDASLSRFNAHVAMRQHTKEQAKEGEKETKSLEERSVTKWEPTVEGYLRFLVDSKLVYDTLEQIIEDSNFPTCASPVLFDIGR